jgi:hypothetical protein
MALIKSEAFDKQAEFLQLCCSSTAEKRVLWNASRGSGKTTALIKLAGSLLANHKELVIGFVTRRATNDLLIAIIDKMKSEDEEFDENFLNCHRKQFSYIDLGKHIGKYLYLVCERYDAVQLDHMNPEFLLVDDFSDAESRLQEYIQEMWKTDRKDRPNVYIASTGSANKIGIYQRKDAIDECFPLKK